VEVKENGKFSKQRKEKPFHNNISQMAKSRDKLLKK
jgi:hypothetical protein